MNDAIKQGFRQRWEALSPDHKRYAVIAGGILAFLVIATPLLSSDEQQGKGPLRAKPQRIEQLLTSANTRDLGITGVAKEVDDIKRTQNETLIALDEIRDQLNGEGGTRSEEALRQELNALRTELAAVKGGAGVFNTSTPPVPVENLQTPPAAAKPAGARPPVRSAPPGTVWETQQSGPPAGPPGQRGKNPAPQPGIRTIKASTPPAQTAQVSAKKKHPTVYLPSGSIVSGVLLNGMDAPTGRNASSDPLPVLVRIKHEAIMAGRRKLDLRECHALAAGFGDLSSERLYLRAEKISCIRSDGGVIDMPIAMYAVGEDGKAGLRGKLNSKQGAVLARAMVAGFAEGISRAFSNNNYSPVIPGGGFDLGAQGGQLAESGFSGGASSALDRIASYYLRMSEAMFPVIEVSGGRPVTFVVLNGVDLDLVADQ